MKRNLLGLFAFFLAFACYGQIQISTDTVRVTHDPADPLYDFEIVGHAYIVNTSNATISVNWVRQDIDKPSRWTWAICDKNSCYPDFIQSSSEIPAPVELAPGDTSIIDAHMYHQGEYGYATIKTELYLEGDPNTKLDEIVYIIGSQPTSSTNELSVQGMTVFPNPVYHTFHLNNASDVATIEIYNMLGRKLKSFESSASNQYYIGELPAGLYLASMKNKLGKTMKTVRLVKRTIMP